MKPLLYHALLPEQRRKDSIASKALQELVHHIQHSSNALDPSLRRSSIRAITSDLTAHLSGGTDWSAQSTLDAISLLKALGRSPVATEDLISHFPLFLFYANLLPSASLQLGQHISSSVQSTLSNPLIAQESLRIVANALFLHPLSRSSNDLLPALNPLVQLAIRVPQQGSDLVPQSHENQDTNSFLASRVLFLITAVPSNLVVELIEKTSLIKHLQYAFKQEIAKQLNPQARSHWHPFHDSLIEYLKLIFNVMVHYPKSILQFDHTALDPTNRSFSYDNVEPGSSPGPSSPAVPASPRRLSLKQRFNNQINFKKFRFRNQAETSDCQDLEQDPLYETTLDNDERNNNSKKTFLSSSYPKFHRRSSSLANEAQELLGPVTTPANSVFAGLLPYLVQLFLLEPIPQPPNLKPPFNSYMQTFLNFLPSAYCFFDDYSNLPSTPYSSWNPKIPPLIIKLIIIIDRVTEYYCPNDPDDRLVKQKCQTDGVDLDVDLTQVVLLTANLISPHSSFSSNSSSSPPVQLSREHREALIEMIVPSDIDRTISLNKQANLIGRILRLMNSIGFETLKQTCGRFLEALYANDTDHLASQVGYGPLAGYFVSNGKPGINQDTNNPHLSNNSEINPITGTYWTEDSQTGVPEFSTMSDEEKEREAEQLCALFDRMNRGGVVSVQDPRQLAVQSGRFLEIENSIDANQEQIDQIDEEKALRELEIYKDKQKSNTVVKQNPG